MSSAKLSFRSIRLRRSDGTLTFDQRMGFGVSPAIRLMGEWPGTEGQASRTEDGGSDGRGLGTRRSSLRGPSGPWRSALGHRPLVIGTWSSVLGHRSLVLPP